MEHGQNSDEFTGWMIWGSNTNGARDFSCVHSVQNRCRSHPASYSLDIRFFFLEVRWLGSEVDHSSPCSTELRMSGGVPCLSLYAFVT